jgi:3-carboxy-cis,cis-muconate cycloisomerase
VLAEGLVPDPARMRQNLDVTHGLLFADAAAARLAPTLGAETAHKLVEEAAGAVRDGAGSLAEVLAQRPETAGIDLAPAFDLAPAVRAGARTTDRALAETARFAALLTP